MWEEGPSVEELPTSDCPMGMSVVHFLHCLLMKEGLSYHMENHPLAGRPRLYREAGWTEVENRTENSTPPRFLVQVPALGS